jgi:dihydroorotate dehydrogenase
VSRPCKLIIGAPFGNYFRRPWVTSTRGTYTWDHRAGPVVRLWRVLKTVRYFRRTESWVNKLGLPSPSIRALGHEARTQPVHDDIVSIHGFNEVEWRCLAVAAGGLHPLAVEFNLSCPNVGQRHRVVGEALPAVRTAVGDGLTVIAKLPPLRWMDMAVPLFGVGVRHFHLCNTIPTPGGGLSGKPLKQYSLWAVEELRQRFGREVTLVGGGGVTCLADVKDYVKAGADHVAVASMLFNPFNWKKLEVFRDHLGPSFGDP